jgi:DNA-binding beta-propeller fold protein YncE
MLTLKHFIVARDISTLVALSIASMILAGPVAARSLFNSLDLTYVTNPDSNQVTVIESGIFGPNVVATIIENIGNHPSGIALTPDGKQAWVTS